MSSFNYENDRDYAPQSRLSRTVDIVWNFLTAVGFIAFVAGCGYLYARFV